MNDKFKTDELNDLFKGILSLENIEECYDFFEDLCTLNEIKSMSQRFQVARLLKNNITYSEIEKMTGASPSTIARINRCLEAGPGGYQIVINKLDK